MTEQEKTMASMALSKPAQRLWDRVRRSSNYYPWNPHKVGKYMQELQAAGLITHTGRVKVIAAYWTPVGVESLQIEKYPS